MISWANDIRIINHFSVDTARNNVKLGNVALLPVVPGVMGSDASSSSEAAGGGACISQHRCEREESRGGEALMARCASDKSRKSGDYEG